MEERRRIWFVENNPIDRDLIRMAFEQIGAENEILILGFGNELIERLDSSEEEEYPSLIVLDYYMEEMGGEEVLNRIKANPFTKHLPIVVYTSVITPLLRDQLKGRDVLMIIEKGEDFVRLSQQAQFFLDLVQDV